LHVIPGKTVPLHANRHERAEWRDVKQDDVAGARARWDERFHRQQETLRCPAFLNPTLLKSTISGIAPVRHSRAEVPPVEVASLIGTLVHRILEQWDFADDPTRLIDRADAKFVSIAADDSCNTNEIAVIIKDILEVFARSQIYQTLREATIVGREVPFAIPWVLSESQDSGLSTQRSGLQSPHSVMEGIIDLVYRFNGDIWIADYKTDHITAEETAARAQEYRLQAQVYTKAVAQCLGVRPKGFQFIFLRTGTVVPVLS
jgi:ATP-dependent helicase/nuclease subunit A